MERILNAVDHAPDRLAKLLENEFATSVNGSATPLPEQSQQAVKCSPTGMVTIENRLCFEVTRPLPPRCRSHQP
jgi:hypothetical protein